MLRCLIFQSFIYIFIPFAALWAKPFCWLQRPPNGRRKGSDSIPLHCWWNCGKWRHQLWTCFHPPVLFWLGTWNQGDGMDEEGCLGWDVSLNASSVPSCWMQMSKHLWLKRVSLHIFQPYCSINPVSERKWDPWRFHAVWLLIKMAWKCMGHKVKENRSGITWPEFNFIIKCWKKKEVLISRSLIMFRIRFCPTENFGKAFSRKSLFPTFFFFFNHFQIIEDDRTDSVFINMRQESFCATQTLQNVRSVWLRSTLSSVVVSLHQTSF